MISRHQRSFERIYRGLGGLNLDIEFPLAQIDRFNWQRGEGNDGYYSYHYRRFTAHILSRLHLDEGQSVLVVGCGFGFDEKNIKSLFPGTDLWSIDISAEMLTLAIASRSPSRFALALAERLPFPDHSFDRVLSREVIEHVISPRTMLQEIHRVLRPGGLAVITTENERSLGPIHYYDLHLRKRIASLLRFPLASSEYRNQAPTLKEMKEMATGAGLRLLDYFWDGALYQYLIEISPLARGRIAHLAHFFSCLENHRRLAPLFCDQEKYLLQKEGGEASRHPAPGVYYACIQCKGRLISEDGHYACSSCGHRYPLQREIPSFIPDQLPEAVTEGREDQIQQERRPAGTQIFARLFPRVNRAARGFYSGVFLLMALLTTLLVKKNRHRLSHVLARDDPYQRYLRRP